MYYLNICKPTTPQEYYSQHGFSPLEEAVKNLEVERVECVMGHIDGRKQITYDKLYPIWKSYFDQVLPNHINDSSYMSSEQVQKYIQRIK